MISYQLIVVGFNLLRYNESGYSDTFVYCVLYERITIVEKIA